MANLLSHLTTIERRQLLQDLNYLNLGEIRSFCRRHAIPYAIYIEDATGRRRRTADTDRKSVVLERIRRFLSDGKVPPATCFAADVVSDAPLPQRFTPQHRLYYGWYDKSHAPLIDCLRKLTGGAFRSGAVARILARDFWSRGVAPTLAEFAEAWCVADDKGLGVERGEHPEAAWLTDRARGTAGSDWKAKRLQKARHVLQVLESIRQG